MTNRAEKNATLQWTNAISSAPWSPRTGHTAASFNNKIWILGGVDVFYVNDIWNSSDGENWIQVSGAIPWHPRCYHTTIVSDNMIWLLGGVAGNFFNDIWKSVNGEDWVQVTDSAPWMPRAVLQSFVFDNKIWVIGGINEGAIMPYLNDIWYSSDGVNWTCATDDPEWGILDGYSMAVFQDKMWVMAGYNHTGGYLVGDVWSSTDGTNWMYEGDCGWGSDHTAVVAGGGIWLMGGNYHGYWTNGVWYSPDGTNWAQAICNSHWSPRIRHASVAFDGKIWVLGGWDTYADHTMNDVWYAEVFNAHFSGAPITDTAPLTVQFTDESISVLETITNWLWDFGDGNTSTEQHPVHTYDLRGLYDVSLTVTSVSNTDTETKTGYIHVTDGEHPYHSADRDQDHTISLSELLRIIQFYNSGGLHCQSGTEDGYDPGMGDQACDLHSSDYNPPDWTINMSELLRIIQLFRSPGYYPCIDGEDGFCVE